MELNPDVVDDEPPKKRQEEKTKKRKDRKKGHASCRSSVPPSLESSFADLALVEQLLENTNLWGRIFGYLDVRDRIRLEMTNKRFRTLMLDCWKGETSFDITSVMPVSTESRKRRERAAAAVAICCSRIGATLVSLKVTNKGSAELGELGWRTLLRAISEVCPNIASINFHVVDNLRAPSGLRFDSFTHLRSLSFTRIREKLEDDDDDDDDDDDERYVPVSPATILSTPPSIESIVGAVAAAKYFVETPAQLEAFFAERPLLRELRIGRLSTGDRDDEADILSIISDRCPNLKIVDLVNCRQGIHFRGISSMSFLRQLHIRFVFSIAEIVAVCEQSPLLEALTLNLNGDAQTLYSIAALTQLRELVVRDIAGGFNWDREMCDYDDYYDPITPEAMFLFVRKLFQNSGASLRRLELGGWSACLPAPAIDVIAKGGNAKLRRLAICVHTDDVKAPVSIRSLIDYIVANPGWISSRDKLKIDVTLFMDWSHYDHTTRVYKDDVKRECASFMDLCHQGATTFPDGVKPNIKGDPYNRSQLRWKRNPWFTFPSMNATRESALEYSDTEIRDRLLANGDVWACIFDFLGPKERICLEMTNKRFRNLILGLWQHETSFDITSIVPVSTDMRKRAAAVIAICCGRIGAALQSLKLSRRGGVELDWTNDIGLISEECSNIQSIHFHIEGLTHNSVHFIVPSNLRFDSFSNLRSLSFTSGRDDVFVQASNTVFASIPPSIERIVGLEGLRSTHNGLYEDVFETAAHLEAFFADRPSLREVRLRELHTLRTWENMHDEEMNANIFPVIAERCPHLKVIDLMHCCEIKCRGIVALSGMRELRFDGINGEDMPEVCERNPHLEILVVRCSSGFPVSMNAVAKLTNLRELDYGAGIEGGDRAVLDFIRKLGINSGHSLRRFGTEGYLTTASIEALANKCTKLRRVRFRVKAKHGADDVEKEEDDAGKALPASIRYLVDCIVGDPSWTPNDKLEISVYVHGSREECKRTVDACKAFSAPEANLPAGVSLHFQRGGE